MHPPPRTVSHGGSRVTFFGAQTWRESLAAFSAVLLLASILVSLLVIFIYELGYRAVVEELFDYLDKTVAISKINYNDLGLLKLNSTEMTMLSSHKSYRTLLSCFLFSDLACLVALVLVLVYFFSVDVQSGKRRAIYWITLGLLSLYCVVSVHLLTFLLLPYSSLGDQTESLLDRAIPHNPGGLGQMEDRFGCTFDLDLYDAFRRRNNPTNTCDPHIAHSLVPRPWLFLLMGLRLLPFVVFVLLAIKRTPLSEAVAQLMEKQKMRGEQSKRLYVKKQPYRASSYQVDIGRSPGASVLKEPREAKLPPAPSPGIDHSISYNNAAFLATSGGLNSSRSSELSRIEDIDMFKGSTHHTSGSIMSEV